MKEKKLSIIWAVVMSINAFLLSASMIICFICYANKDFVNDKVDTTVTNSIAPVSEQITAINGSIDGLKVADTEIIGYIDTLETAIAKCESELAATNAKITELEESIEETENATITQLNETKTALEGQIAIANTAIDTLKAKDTTIEGRITALETAKASLESEIAAIKNRLDIVEETIANINSCTCDTSLYATKTQLNDAKTALESQLVTVNTEITALQTDGGKFDTAITALETSVGTLESELAATKTTIDSVKEELENAIKAVETSVLAQLNTLKSATESDIATLKTEVATLKAKDAEFTDKITALETTVATLASKDWANATFATLEQYNDIQTEISGIKTSIESVNASITALETRLNSKIATDITAAIGDLRNELSADYVAKITAATNSITTAYTGAIATAKTEITAAYTAAISSAISKSETSMKEWVNTTLADGYYTIAQIDAKIGALETADALLSANVSTLETALAKAKTELTNEYAAAITQAINDNNGVIDTKIENAITAAKSELNASINAIELRVATLETEIEKNSDKIAELEQNIKDLQTQINCLKGNHIVEGSYNKNDDGTHTYTCTACQETITEEHDYVDNYACECGDKIEITSLSFIIDDVEYDSTNTSASEPARITGSCTIKIKLYGTNLNLITLGSHGIKGVSTIGWLIDVGWWTFNADNTEATETYSLGDFDDQTSAFEIKYKNPDGKGYVNSGVYYVYDVEAFWGENINRLYTAGTLAEALASDATYIKLEKSLMLTDAIEIAASKTLTIDFDTYTLTTASGKNGFTNNGTLTLLNGTITDNNTTTYAVENAATLTMTDMTVTGGYPLYQTGVSATLTNTTLKNQGAATTRTGCYVQSGSVTATNCAFEGRYGLYAAKGTQWTSKGQITLNDCSFKGSWGLRINEGFDLTLTGDTTFINADPYSSFWALYLSSSDMTVDLSGMTSGLTNMKIDMFYVKKIYIKLPEGYGAYNVYNEQINLSNGLTSAIQLTIKETAN